MRGLSGRIVSCEWSLQLLMVSRVDIVAAAGKRGMASCEEENACYQREPAWVIPSHESRGVRTSSGG
jgi:hypothetical protein